MRLSLCSRMPRISPPSACISSSPLLFPILTRLNICSLACFCLYQHCLLSISSNSLLGTRSVSTTVFPCTSTSSSISLVSSVLQRAPSSISMVIAQESFQLQVAVPRDHVHSKVSWDIGEAGLSTTEEPTIIGSSMGRTVFNLLISSACHNRET
ncbi:hypothetical protein EV702DRAFT_139082 [Suillus placidus]|uniref:Uncharacterized protein n=1 Tax=Suillus placidus TaxID=48579 RepID=A0A9P7D4I0_9AGAM|nr:hypothetical protein EV702DRAFT_139082 [Suillus placidus]